MILPSPDGRFWPEAHITSLHCLRHTHRLFLEFLDLPMSAPTPTAIEVKAFLPAQDFRRSLLFYQALGFNCVWSDGKLAELRLDTASFILQDFYIAEHARSFQMHLLVASIDAWHAMFRTEGIDVEFGVRPGEIANQPWGLRDFVFLDPNGVMWRVAQRLEGS
ncbi:VOC family protein [Luteimonas sp. 3794]|uniref:VOC family protein n=1 Tax=Luteimonas sp. 3794 TaxID=2817730 RepID=UPI00285C5A50|nr:VOC family protein [Luteimonas sp. 3794]MDR6990207.1 catechol 2,3-dioxygenase-like lactoylglutathione lyase family enzyme [Luteimonas sp. 3794]